MLIDARGISKQFAGVEVLTDVDLSLQAGEIHALLGENGAGKSTFAKILAGVHTPTRGTVKLNGETIKDYSPLAAQTLGITLIHQEPISFPDMSVAENLVLGLSEHSWFSRVPWAEMERSANQLMASLGVSMDVNRAMRGLSIADQQMVEIARALSSKSQLIIMDEPTAPLTPKEVDTLFSIARRLRDEGRTIVFISHRLEEVRELCDRATVFRDGQLVHTANVSDHTDDEIIRLMIGRPLQELVAKTSNALGQCALEVRDLSLPGKFNNISLSVKKGEVVGLAGLVGAGRTDVARALFGVIKASSGSISINGKAAVIDSPASAIELGLAFVPEDRAVAGIFKTLSVQHNITAAVPKKIAPNGFIKRSIERALAMESLQTLSIRLASLRQPIGELSGGNQQKTILARWLHTDPQILILDEPTRGIDIGVKAEFYEMINLLAASGRAVLLISSELPELLALCDRILVMSEGEMTAEFDRDSATQEAIMQAAVPQTRGRLAAGLEQNRPQQNGTSATAANSL